MLRQLSETRVIYLDSEQSFKIILSAQKMAKENTDFKFGAALCWLSSLMLPLGLLAIGGGPCAGPRNAAGSAILLGVGLVAVIGPVYGVFRVIQFLGTVGFGAKVFGVVSLLYASAVALIGSLFLVFGAVSLRAFMH